jgi:hypothetical protein
MKRLAGTIAMHTFEKQGLLAALLAISSLSPAHASEFGRLFYTPEQRAAIDQSPSHNVESLKTLNGIVQRSDGMRTIWVDGEIRILNNKNQPADSQTFPAPNQTHSVPVKVGQPLPIEKTPP